MTRKTFGIVLCALAFGQVETYALRANPVSETFEDLQARIDAVAAAGGGRVNVPPGVVHSSAPSATYASSMNSCQCQEAQLLAYSARLASTAANGKPSPLS